jgi:NOL1/NOP2/fmu family ribosome biogenesis protein
MMINDVVRTIKEAREANETILQFPDGPKVVNNNGSVTPTIQTTTQSVRTTTTSRTGITIPSSRYGGLLDMNGGTAIRSSQVPSAISIHTRSFREAAIGRTTSPDNSDNESETFRSGLTSSKSNREVELESENQRLAKQLQEKEEHCQLILKQVQEGFDRQRLRDREYQEQQNKVHKQEMLAMQAEHKAQMTKMASDKEEKMARMVEKNEEQMEKLKAIIIEMATHIDNDTGSTPKRPKKRPVSTTPSRPEPEEMTGMMQDEEPVTLEEGADLT